MKLKNHLLLTIGLVLTAALAALLLAGCEMQAGLPAGPVAATCFKPCECTGKCCKTRTGDLPEIPAKGQFVPKQNEILPMTSDTRRDPK